MERRTISFSPPDITELEIAEVAEALRSGWITTGARVKLLERRIAAYIETGKTDIDCNTNEAKEKYSNKVVCLNSAMPVNEFVIYRSVHNYEMRQIMIVCDTKKPENVVIPNDVEVHMVGNDYGKIRKIVKKTENECSDGVVYHMHHQKSALAFLFATMFLGVRKHSLYTVHSTFSGRDIKYRISSCACVLMAKYANCVSGAAYHEYTQIVKQMKGSHFVESGERFIKKIGYSGLFSVEFIRGKDGKDYFLEINMRNDGNAYCVESAGVNLPYIWSYYQSNGEIPDVPLTFSEPIYFIPDFNDLKIALKEIGLVKWIIQFRQAQSHSIFNKQDMKPFRYEFRHQVKRILKV